MFSRYTRQHLPRTLTRQDNEQPAPLRSGLCNFYRDRLAGAPVYRQPVSSRIPVDQGILARTSLSSDFDAALYPPIERNCPHRHVDSLPNNSGIFRARHGTDVSEQLPKRRCVVDNRCLGLSSANQMSGRRLQKRWLKLQALFQDQMRKVSQVPRPAAYELIAALYQYSRGRPEFFVAYLRSDRPITRSDRENMAQIFEEKFDLTPKLGRPRHLKNRSAATEALFFYRLWRAENRRLGIRDHGQGDAMKDEAVRFIIAALQLKTTPEAIRTLMDRPAHRRN